MRLTEKMIGPALRRPKTIIVVMFLLALVSSAFLVRAHVDVDREHMLPEQEKARAVYAQIKKEFNLHDMVVLGVVNEQHPDGVFNPDSLRKIYALSKFAATLSDPHDPRRRVVGQDIIAPDTVDNILQAGQGQLRFEWLMKLPPTSRADALKIRAAALADPLLKGTMVSEDGKAIAIQLPISRKDFAYAAAARLRGKIQELGTANGDEFHLAGLPLAEETFGKEMFSQMAISALMAMLMSLLLLLIFFRNLRLAIAPLILALCTAIAAMGLLIGLGHPLHLMSAMLPICIVPMALIGPVHVLSKFCDAYPRFKDKKKTLIHVLNELSASMFFTSLISAAGFAFFAVMPMQPVKDFGLFAAVGIMLAWVLTMLFIPAYVMTIKATSLEQFGRTHSSPDSSLLNRHLRWIGNTASSKPWMVIACGVGLMIVGLIGSLMLRVNDNPVNWFGKTHAVRVADRVLHQHLSGIHDAYLVLSGSSKEPTAAEAAVLLKKELDPLFAAQPALREKTVQEIDQEAADAHTSTELTDSLAQIWNSELDHVPSDDKAVYDFWAAAIDALERVRSKKEIFKRPELLRYLAGLQAHLAKQGNVGKSNSISDVIKKANQELHKGNPQQFAIPDTVNAVADILLFFRSSHNPDDLGHLISQDCTKANLWLQLRSGDGKNMERVIENVEQYFRANPPPEKLELQWAGQNYINLIWQQKMVSGMMKALLAGCALVFVLMAVTFRSPTFGLLAMIPLTFAMSLLYGIIGLTGKDYDMPAAVISSLALSVAVDFAVHFLRRARITMAKTGDWNAAIKDMFDAPARAILRNIMIIAVGFSPLLFAPLVPHQTVGLFLVAIMVCSGFATLWILPALLTVMKSWMFKRELKAFAEQKC